MASQHGTDRRGAVILAGSWPPERNAPGELELVRRFLNTSSHETGAELLATVGELADWASTEHRPLPASVTRHDVDTLLELRTLLRALVPSNDANTGSDGWPLLDQFAARLDLGLRFAFDPPALLARRRATDALLADLLVGVWNARRDGSWTRLRACSNDACRWVIFDSSKNGAARWCSESACGARHRAAQYRERQRRGAHERSTTRT